MFMDRNQRMRNLIMLLSLGLLPCLFIACATSPTYYKTYNYATITRPVNVLYHPRSQFSTLEKRDTHVLIVKWQPRRGPDTSVTTPSQVTLKVELIGPFPRLESFYQIPQPKGGFQYRPTTPVVTVAPVIKTTNRVNHIYTSNLQFLQSLTGGYYQVLEMIDISENNGNGSIHVTGRCIIKM
jgi:hypothetical protein